MLRGRYKLYLPYLKGSRTLLFLSLLSAIVFAAANALGLPFLMGKVLPAVFGSEAARAAPLLSWPNRLGGAPILFLPKGHELAFAIGFLPAVMLLRGLGEFFSTYLLNLAGLRVIEAVRRDVFAKLQQLHLGFFGRLSIGDLLSRLIADANSVRLVLVDVSNDLIVQPLTLVFALGYVLVICFSHENGYWFLACLLVVPAAVLLVRAVGMRIQRRSRPVPPRDQPASHSASCDSSAHSLCQIRQNATPVDSLLEETADTIEPGQIRPVSRAGPTFPSFDVLVGLSQYSWVSRPRRVRLHG